MSTAFGSVRLTVHAAAVSHGSASNLTLYNLDVKSEAVANTASREVRKGAQLQFSYNVPAVTVDSIASTLPHPVRLLKVDVEGHEASVFAGAVQLLTRRAVDVLTFEYGDKMSNTTWRYNKQSQDAAPLSRRGFPRLALFVEWLEGLGYVSFFFGNHVLLPLSGEYWDDNYELCDDRLTAGPFTSGAICWFDILAIRADYRYHATILSRFVHEGALTDGGDCIASHIAKTEHTNANPDAVTYVDRKYVLVWMEASVNPAHRCLNSTTCHEVIVQRRVAVNASEPTLLEIVSAAVRVKRCRGDHANLPRVFLFDMKASVLAGMETWVASPDLGIAAPYRAPLPIHVRLDNCD